MVQVMQLARCPALTRLPVVGTLAQSPEAQLGALCVYLAAWDMFVCVCARHLSSFPGQWLEFIAIIFSDR